MLKIFKNVIIQKFIIFEVLAWSLIRSSKFIFLKLSNQKYNNSIVRKRVI